MAEPMTNERLAVLLDEMNRTAVGYLSDEVSVDQDSNLDRYLGKPYGDEEEGRSNALSMDVAEVVDWALPDLLEPFLSGDRVVEFEPNAQKDEEWVDTASDVANHEFFNENNGVIVLHDTLKSALIQKIGYTKTVWKAVEKNRRETLSGLSILNVQALHQEDGVIIESVESEPIQVVDESMAAAFTDGQQYTVTLTKIEKSGCNDIASVAPEEIKVASRSSDIEKTRYIAQETEMTRGELVEMGFDPEVVATLQAEKTIEGNRKDTRFDNEQRQETQAGSNEFDIVTLIEEYPLIDANGDGKPERLQVFRVGKTILQDPVEVTEHPFDCWTADRIPHRLIGLALADKVKQTQKIKTHLTRNMLDNVYLANNPRIEIPEEAAGDDTIADLLDVRIGGFIRTRGQGGQMRPIEIPDRSATALQAITYMDTVREMQSGITRNGMALSSEVIDAKSATESRRQDRNEQVRKRLMCRMIAETLLVPLFRKILKNLVSYQDAPRTMKISGKWVEFDARSWDADCKARVSVGLGHANRDEMLQAAQVVGQAQLQMLPLGLVRPEHAFETAKKLVEGVGWRFADKYFVDPASPEGQQAMQQSQQQKPDPKMAEVQAKTQLEQVKAQFQQQMDAQNAQMKAQLAQIDAATKKQIAEMKAAMDFQIAQTRIAAEQEIANKRLEAEMDLANRKAQVDAEIKRETASVKARERANGSGNVRFGGQIG